MKLNILIILLVIINMTTAVGSTQHDTMSSKTLTIVSKLDSLAKNPVIDLDSDSKCFEIFKSLFMVASDNELLYLIKNHKNPAVKAYAYLGLMIRNNKNAAVLYKKNFPATTISIDDMAWQYSSGSSGCIAFMEKLSTRKKRLTKAAYSENNIHNDLDIEERNAINGENKIRQEQKKSKVVVPQ